MAVVVVVVVMVMTAAAIVAAASVRVGRAVVAMPCSRMVVPIGSVVVASTAVVHAGGTNSGVATAHRSEREGRDDQEEHRACESCENGFNSRFQHGRTSSR
jgi:hypothetical protein